MHIPVWPGPTQAGLFCTSPLPGKGFFNIAHCELDMFNVTFFILLRTLAYCSIFLINVG